VTIEVFFQGQSSKTIAKVNITEGIPPVEEKPEKKPINISLDTTTIVLILMVLILAFNVYFFMFKGRNDSQKQPQQPQSPQQPQQPINDYRINKQKEKNTSLRPPKL
jgi:flagellar basal body-associated protein FliL